MSWGTGRRWPLPEGSSALALVWSSPWWPSPRRAQLAPPGALPCPASADCTAPSLPCQALQLLLFQTGRNDQEGQRGGKRGNFRERLQGTTSQLRAGLRVQTAPRAPQRARPRAGTAPGSTRGAPAPGSTWGTPAPAPARYSWPCVPRVRARSSTPAASRYATVNSPNTESSPR